MVQAGKAFDIQECCPEFRSPEPSKEQATGGMGVGVGG